MRQNAVKNRYEKPNCRISNIKTDQIQMFYNKHLLANAVFGDVWRVGNLSKKLSMAKVLEIDIVYLR